MKFIKYQALGNDYLVISPQEIRAPLTPDLVRWLCDRHYGAGSDGLLMGPYPSEACDFSLRFYNPDGSEFEKSGNGLRIFARYLWDCDLVSSEPFCVHTPGGDVTCQVHNGGQRVTIEMGQVRFSNHEIPVSGPVREVLNEPLTIEGVSWRISAASIGNPHCVVLCDYISKEDTLGWGPKFETHAMFPNKTNVQFLKVVDRDNIEIQIWERGAGFTLSSGTSSIAAAAVARRLGLCNQTVLVQSPGGVLKVSLSPDYHAVLEGPVVKVYEGIACWEEAGSLT
jgi:diaminopimelate epimerase